MCGVCECVCVCVSVCVVCVSVCVCVCECVSVCEGIEYFLYFTPPPSSLVWREGGKEQAVLFYGRSFLLPHTLTPSHPHTLTLTLLLPRVQRVLISLGSHQPTRLGPSQNIPSTLA